MERKLAYCLALLLGSFVPISGCGPELPEGVNKEDLVLVDVPDPNLADLIQTTAYLQLLKSRGVSTEAVTPEEARKAIPLNKLTCRTIGRLHLEGLPITSLEGIQHCENIQEIYFVNCQIRDLSPLRGLKGLRLVTLSDNQVSDLTPLQKLSTIEQLVLRNNQISDIHPLRSLVALEMLDLANNHVTSIEPITALPELAFVTLSFNDGIQDLGTGLPSALMLGLRACGISELSVLNAFPKVGTLDVGENGLTSLLGAEQCSELEILYADSNEIEDFNQIPAMQKLAVISLRSNKLRQIEAFPSMPSLRRLTLSENDLVYLPDIGPMPKLDFLDLDDNPLSEAICQGVAYYRQQGIEIEANGCSGR